MATSGTTAFAPDFNEIAEEAWERAGREMRTGYDLRTARRSMNLLTIEWQNRGINLWTVDEGTIAMVADTATYNLPTDTIDLLQHVIRENAGNASTQTDLNLSRLSMPNYAAIPNKLTTGRPINIYIDRAQATPTVTMWPVPDASSTYTLVYWRMRRIEDAGSGVETPDIPHRFYPPLMAGLAFYIAQKEPEFASRLPMLQEEYDRQMRLAMREDRDRSPMRIVPRVRRV